MVTFSIISDLHLSSSTTKEAYTPKADYLILAGDIGNVTEPSLLNFLAYVSPSYKKVIYVLGNHEYYNKNNYSYIGIVIYIKHITLNIKNLVILDNDYIDIEGSLRIFGSTLWSNVGDRPLNLPIFDENNNQITSSWMNREHYRSLHILENMIQTSITDKKRLIVVTHYCPTFMNTLKTSDVDSPNRFLYCSNLDRYLRKEYVYTWIFGHTHVNVDYLTEHDTRLITNQYMGEFYNKNKVVHIKDVYKKY
jgi:predicted phosphodiesterase